jgi:hypothetical protein
MHVWVTFRGSVDVGYPERVEPNAEQFALTRKACDENVPGKFVAHDRTVPVAFAG